VSCRLHNDSYLSLKAETNCWRWGERAESVKSGFRKLLRPKLLNNGPSEFDLQFTRLRYDGFLGPPMIGEKRLFGLIALVLGLVAGVLILLDVQAKQNINLLNLIAGIGVLYGSYLIYRGKTSILFGWGKTRLGSVINLAIGVLTLLIPGGVGGIASVLAIVSGILGFLSA